MRPARITRQMALGIMPVGSSTTPWIGGTTPHSLLGPIRTSPLRQCFYAAFPSQTTPRNRRSTGTSGHWWKLPPFNRWRSLHHDTDLRPLSPPGEWGRTRRIAPSAHRYSRRAWHRRAQLRHSLTRHPLHTDRLCANASGRTKTLAASSATGVGPVMMMTSIRRQ